MKRSRHWLRKIPKLGENKGTILRWKINIMISVLKVWLQPGSSRIVDTITRRRTQRSRPWEHFCHGLEGHRLWTGV